MSEDSSFELSRLPGEPIIHSKLSPGWEVAETLTAGIDELTSLLDEADEPCFYISDVSEVSMSFDVIIKSANMATRLSSAVLHHPNMRAILVVTSNKLMDMASRGLGSEAFGNVPVRVFATVEDALAYAREQLATG